MVRWSQWVTVAEVPGVMSMVAKTIAEVRVGAFDGALPCLSKVPVSSTSRLMNAKAF